MKELNFSIHNKSLKSQKLHLVTTPKKLRYTNNIISIHKKATSFTRNDIMTKISTTSTIRTPVPGKYLLQVLHRFTSSNHM